MESELKEISESSSSSHLFLLCITSQLYAHPAVDEQLVRREFTLLYRGCVFVEVISRNGGGGGGRLASPQPSPATNDPLNGQ